MSSEQPPEYTALAVQLIAKRGAAGAKAMLDYLEHNYADPAARLEALGLTLQQIDAAPEPEPVQLPPLTPASVDCSPKRSAETGARVSDNRARKALPSRLDDPGLTAVTDSGLPPLIGYAATAVWLCLLRHANGRVGRLVKRIGYREIGAGTGLSRQQIRAGLAVLLTRGMVQRTQEGRTQRGTKLTAEYVVHFPTAVKLERWRVATTKENA